MLLKRIAADLIALALTLSFLLCTRLAVAQADIGSPVDTERIAGELRAIEALLHAMGRMMG